MSRKIRKFRTINWIRETNENFDSCNSCKRLVPSRLHELHESKFPFVSRIEFIRSKLSNFSAHVYGIADLTVEHGDWMAGACDAITLNWISGEPCSAVGRPPGARVRSADRQQPSAAVFG